MSTNQERILAIDLSIRGFGFAVLDLPFNLIVARRISTRTEKTARTIGALEKLLKRYSPTTIVIEDTESPGSLRQPRIRELLKTIETHIARAHDIPVKRISRMRVLRAFDVDGQVTKLDIARRLVETFPDLGVPVPKPRRLWESETEQMAIFDALALAVAYARA